MKIEAIVLGVIQGLTEWFPISSSGHLEIAEIILKLRLPLLFKVALHVGTLAVTIFFFKSDVRELLRALVRPEPSRLEGRIMLQRIIVGTAFTAITGLSLMPLESLFHDIRTLGFLFLISGLITYLSKVRRKERKSVDSKGAALIGVAQGFSILPGLSRSGLTISVALMLGVKHEEAFKFSFLLSVPAILGGLITTLAQYEALQRANFGIVEILLGTFISALLGYFSLKILRRALRHFHKFALYPLLLGLLLILLEEF